jgi:hypothetical protein
MNEILDYVGYFFLVLGGATFTWLVFDVRAVVRARRHRCQ